MSIELRAAAQAYLDAWNRHDANAIAEFFEEHADFVDICGSWSRGRSEIERRHARNFATIYREAALSGRVESVRFLSTDLAVVHLCWEMRVNSEDAEPSRKGVLVLVFAHLDDGWLIHAGHNTETQPASERDAA